jgi:dihydroorotate dehydrogenase
MKLRNLDFGGYVFGQSGIQGFFGEGDEYKHHKLYKFFLGKFGFSFVGMSFVAKTITLPAKVFPYTSNTELIQVYKMKDFFPASIWWSFMSMIKGFLLNALALPGPGLHVMLLLNKFQQRSDVFQISVMLMETTLEKRLIEAKEICSELFYYMKFGISHSSYAVQINESCPNTEHERIQGEEALIQVVNVFRKELPDVPLILKFTFEVAPETISRLQPYCDAFCIGNTMPFGKIKDKQWWEKLFRHGISPLAKQLKRFVQKRFPDWDKNFEGGLSGKPLFPVLVEWLEKMQAVDPTVVIIAGGGIMKKKNITLLSTFSIVHGVALGSVAINRPFRVQGLINHGNKVFSERV